MAANNRELTVAEVNTRLVKLRQRIKARIVVQRKSRCWIWQGRNKHRVRDGAEVHEVLIKTYDPIDSAKCKRISAVRASYIAHIGDVPKGKRVYRICKNKACVNPEHLTLS